MTSDDNNSPGQLSSAALSDLGLGAQPFEDDRSRGHLNDSVSQSIRSEVEYQLKHGNPLHLLLGPSGAGKSVLLSQLVKHNGDYLKPFIARGDAHFEAKAYLAAILGQFGEETADSIPEHIELLTPHFEELERLQTTPALIIDNAHQAPIEEIAELIIALQTLQIDGNPAARLLLTGVPAFHAELESVGKAFSMPSYDVTHMQALSADRTREYLSFRLNQAGFVGEFPFTDNAVSRIAQNASGIPAKINSQAASYLNKVYNGTGVAASSGIQGGLIGALGWPVIGLGAGALALMILGLSMFGGQQNAPGNDPAATLADNRAAVQTDSTSSTGSSTQALAPSSTAATTASGDDGLLLPQHRDPIAGDNPTDSQTTDATAAQSTTAQPVEPDTDASALVAGAQPETNTTERIIGSSTDTQNQTAAAAATPSDTSEADIAAANPPAPETETTLAVAPEPQPVTPPPAEAPAPDAPAPEAPAAPIAQQQTANPAPASSQPAESEPQTADGVEIPLDEIVQLPTDTDAASVSGVSDGSTDDSDPAEIEPEEPQILRAVENERWVLFQPNTKFTLQLATSRERGYIVEFAQTLPLEGPMAVYPFKIKANGRQVYGLLNGLFNTTDEALAAINAMPAEVRKFKPWIRPIKQLQDEIKLAQ